MIFLKGFGLGPGSSVYHNGILVWASKKGFWKKRFWWFFFNGFQEKKAVAGFFFVQGARIFRGPCADVFLVIFWNVFWQFFIHTFGNLSQAQKNPKAFVFQLIWSFWGRKFAHLSKLFLTICRNYFWRFCDATFSKISSPLFLIRASRSSLKALFNFSNFHLWLFLKVKSSSKNAHCGTSTTLSKKATNLKEKKRI